MNSNNPFKGSIQIDCQKADVKNVNFDATPSENAPITKTLMIHFKDIQLSDDEKRQLTRKDRENLFYFANIGTSIIEEYSQRLITRLSRSRSKTVKVKADNFGVFICVAAILSNKLPTDKNLVFDLGPAPLSLFPKKLITNEFKNGKHYHCHTVKFRKDNSSWLAPFATIREVPSFLRPKKNKEVFKVAA